jgi:hypothetical protein
MIRRPATLREQIGAFLGEGHVGARVVHREPPSIDRSLNRGAVLRRRSAGPQERHVDQLDMDAAVLHGLGGVGDLDQFLDGGFRVGKRAVFSEPH